MSSIPPPNRRFASAVLRDKFLVALDEQDYAALDSVTAYLADCVNLLPNATCALLGLTPGSSYGEGAEIVRQSLPKSAQKID
jgi:hypothetical protein